VGQRAARQGEARLPQEDLPQAAAQDGGVLRLLPQGAPARGAQRLQVAARPEPLRRVPAERRVGPRHRQLLLPAEGRAELQRLPHAAPGVDRLRRALLRRHRQAEGARPPVPIGEPRRTPTSSGSTSP
jgi:hypothetical protein